MVGPSEYEYPTGTGYCVHEKEKVEQLGRVTTQPICSLGQGRSSIDENWVAQKAYPCIVVATESLTLACEVHEC